MQTEDLVTRIESARTIEELKDIMHREVQRAGFHSFGFMHTETGREERTFFVTSTTQGWIDDYVSNGFAKVDPCAVHARRTNQPFSWSQTPLPQRRGARNPAARRVMEAAADHSFRDGLVVPCHYTDALGRHYSSSAVAYWTQDIGLFQRVARRREYQFEFQLAMIYWATRAMNLLADGRLRAADAMDDNGEPLTGRVLTDRERDVLGWAARGKTVDETASILTISRETVVSHLTNAQRKLNCSNKVHTVATALKLGAILF